MKILDRLVDIAAAVWNRRATLIEASGGAALVVAAALVAPALGWAVAGVALVAKAQEIDRRLGKSST